MARRKKPTAFQTRIQLIAYLANEHTTPKAILKSKNAPPLHTLLASAYEVIQQQEDEILNLGAQITLLHSQRRSQLQSQLQNQKAKGK